MTGLVPEKRQDKNGKLVTRHVKPSQSATTKTIPAPQTKTQPAKSEDQLHLEATHRIVSTLLSFTSHDTFETMNGQSQSFAEFNEALVGITPRSMNSVSDRVDSFNAHEKDIVSYSLSWVVENIDRFAPTPEYAESILHYSAELAPVAVAFSPTAKSAMYLNNEITYLQVDIEQRWRGRSSALLLADEEEKALIRGAGMVKFLLEESISREKMPHLSWLGRNLDRLEPFKDIIREHRSLERSYLEELMESEVLSLAGGYL